MMNKIMNMLMLSCKKASALIDKSHKAELSMKENMQLQMHTAMCGICSAYRKQSELLEKLLKRYINNTDDKNTQVVSNKHLQEKIIDKISQS